MSLEAIFVFLAAINCPIVMAGIDYIGERPQPGKVWEVTLKNKMAQPLYANEKVLVLLDADGCLIGLEPQSGKTLWESCSRKPGLVFLGRAGSDIVVRDGESDIIRGIDESTGAERWSWTLPEICRVSMAYVDGELFCQESVLHSIRIDKMDEQWQTHSADKMHPVLIVGEDMYYLKDSYTIVAAKRKSGSTIWERVFYDKTAWPGAICGGMLVYVTLPGVLVALDRTNGVNRWAKKISNRSYEDDRLAPVLIASEESIFLLRRYGDVSEYRCSDGEELWRSQGFWAQSNLDIAADIFERKYFTYLSRAGIAIRDLMMKEKACHYPIGNIPTGVVFDDERVYIAKEQEIIKVPKGTTVNAMDYSKCISEYQAEMYKRRPFIMGPGLD